MEFSGGTGPEEFLVGRPAEIRARGRADNCGHAGVQEQAEADARQCDSPLEQR